MVDLVICHWVTLVTGEEVQPDGFGWAVQCLVALFYDADGLLASPRLDWIQAYLDVLVRLFYRVGLQTNVKKIVGMV